MEQVSRGQLSRDSAEVYEEFFVPALFGPWAGTVAAAAKLRPGDRVLDVGCGTGVLAREAAARVGGEGVVIGIDCSEAMLQVAAAVMPELDWRPGRAEALPFPDESFDAVVSQFSLMFFDDRRQALAEMWRVLRPQGRLTVAVWDALERTPGYAAMTALLDRLFGPEVAGELRAPFSLGQSAELKELFLKAEIPSAEVRTLDGTARFPSLRDWVHVDVRGWTLGDMLDDADCARLVEEALRELRGFVQNDGTVRFAVPAHLVLARKT